MSAIRVDIFIDKSLPLRPDQPEQWSAVMGGERLVHRHPDICHASCRALLARGITGLATFVHRASGTPGVTMDIETGARWIVSEDDRGMRLRPYRPWVPVASLAGVPGSLATPMPDDENAAPSRDLEVLL